MNLLFIGYWNIDDPLTIATIFPHLKILKELNPQGKTVFSSVQRERPSADVVRQLNRMSVVYEPVYSAHSSFDLVNKLKDFVRFPKLYEAIINKHGIERIIARGAPAGGLAYLVSRKTKTPFYVESYEPHGQYMLESGVWKFYDLRFHVEEFLESRQKKYAAGLMPVARNYTRQLQTEGIRPERLKTVPCSVDISRFAFSAKDRNQIRSEIGISPESTVGIYAGKFGGLYMEREAFELFESIFKHFSGAFDLILLTPSVYHEWIRRQIKDRGLPVQNIHVLDLPHDRVPPYLSAADFGIATYRPGKNKAYLSPVKIGEYWANGLPVLIPYGVGDETEIIKNNPFGGVLFDWERINKTGDVYFKDLRQRLSSPREAAHIPQLARRYRNSEFAKDAYAHFLKFD